MVKGAVTRPKQVHLLTIITVLGVMKMGNIAPRVGIEPTSLAFRTSVLTISPPMFPHVTTLLMPMCLYGSLAERSVKTIAVVLQEL